MVIIDSNSHETFPTTPAKSIRLSVSQIILILNIVLEIGVAKNEIVPTFAPIAISASVVVISELNSTSLSYIAETASICDLHVGEYSKVAEPSNPTK